MFWEFGIVNNNISSYNNNNNNLQTKIKYVHICSSTSPNPQEFQQIHNLQQFNTWMRGLTLTILQIGNLRGGKVMTHAWPIYKEQPSFLTNYYLTKSIITISQDCLLWVLMIFYVGQVKEKFKKLLWSSWCL